MKKTIAVVLALLMVFVFTGTAFAVKPTGNLAGAEKVSWNLSANVMPVPPYGSVDIPGSDTASKLIINQPNGNTEVVITGAMNGLTPNTTYTVYLSKGYTPYVFTGWNVTGSYVIDLEYNGLNYVEYLELSQTEDDITGVSLALANNASPWTIESGSVVGNAVNFRAHYNDNSSMLVDLWATIASDGSMSGGWADVGGLSRSGTWSTTTGTATNHTGDTGWSGLFTSTVPKFTFTTDEFGAGSWHVNLRDSDFSGPVPATHTLSVWINAGGTMLISDNFEVVVD